MPTNDYIYSSIAESLRANVIAEILYQTKSINLDLEDTKNIFTIAFMESMFNPLAISNDNEHYGVGQLSQVAINQVKYQRLTNELQGLNYKDETIRKMSIEKSPKVKEIDYQTNIEYMIDYYLYLKNKLEKDNKEVNLFNIYELYNGNTLSNPEKTAYSSKSELFANINNDSDVLEILNMSRSFASLEPLDYDDLYNFLLNGYLSDNETIIFLNEPCHSMIKLYLKGTINSSSFEYFYLFLSNKCIVNNKKQISPTISLPYMPPSKPSPLILDLNGDGIKTTSLTNGVFFDYDGNRFAEKTGWVDPSDALLVRDLDNNGLIDNGGELFGDNTILNNGQKAANGFEALAELDSNRDGWVDQNDEAWNALKLWQDINSNGIVDEGELAVLEDAGISGLQVSYEEQNYTDENENQHRQIGYFTRDDATSGQMTDVWFQSDLSDTHYLDEIEIPDEIAQLPNLRGFGNIPSLHQVMAAEENNQLQTLLQQFVDSDPLTARDMVWDIIYAWTGVTDIDPASRGQNVSDARKLYAMERLWGDNFLSLTCNLQPLSNPHAKDSSILEKVFVEWEQNVASYFMLGSHYYDLYVWAVFAVDAVEDGFPSEIALMPLLDTLRCLYEEFGDSSEKESIQIFFDLLKKYDSKGIACVEMM
ncbi:MAG: hypothetical protein LBP67_04030, partial [Bacteroidales bacterium]|nr:hypothetical protein [Bacteroidales bacterium]